jgi:hypothetical protein
MKPYVATLVTKEEVSLWKAVSWVVDAIPDDFMSNFNSSGSGDSLRCHELARAVHDWISRQPPHRWGGKFVSPGIVDGKYAAIDHTWLETGFGENILDVYVPGELPPVQLRHGSEFLPGQYVPGRLRGDIREDVVEALVSIFEAADTETLSVHVVAAVTAS